MNKTISVLGSGEVGKTLAKGLRDLEYNVVIGSRDGQPFEGWDGEVGTFDDVAARGEIIVLAIKGSAAESVVAQLKDSLAGKIIIDPTNPIADTPPEDGVLSYFTSQNESLMERLQQAAPEANFVKAFNSVSARLMVNPEFTVGRPTMFICGNVESAKKEVAGILDQLGWEVEDFGSAKAARAIEALCMLWCIPGMLSREWGYAFKLLRR